MEDDFKQLITDDLKRLGLSDKAIDYVATATADGGAGDDLTDEAAEQRRQARMERAREMARQMQAEATRWTQRYGRNKVATAADAATDPTTASDGAADGTPARQTTASAPDVAQLLARLTERLDTFEAEGKRRQDEERNQQRRKLILDKAKAIGLPEAVAAKLAIPPTADIDKELGEVMQQLVNGKLTPKQGEPQPDDEAALRAQAKTWAQRLPDRKR